MWKRFRFTAWAFIRVIELQLEPSSCENEDKNHDCTLNDPDCPLRFCTAPEGHPYKHYNDGSPTVKWD